MKKTILIIDDNAEERTVFSTYLRFVGGAILEAADGEEGIRVAREHLPSLILLDLSMPRMDGWETVKLLKQDALTAGIPVVALTAHRLKWQALKEAGFCGYLEKPIVPYLVLEEVERCVGRLHWAPDPAGGGASAERASPSRAWRRSSKRTGAPGGAGSRSR